MTPHNVSSPVSLSYVAALRGITPRQLGSSFTYAVANCRNFELLTCLAASNPEGRFYGLVADELAAARAQHQARMQSVENVFFLHAGAIQNGNLPQLDYLCADETEAALTPAARAAVFDLAKEHLAPGGIFHYAYRAYEDESGPLRFLVREVAPEMNAEQAKGFLQEIKALGRLYLSGNPEIASKLDAAIARGVPDEFFDLYDDGEARSGSFDTLVAMRPRGFSYIGDARIRENYVDFFASPAAQDIIAAGKENPLYEAIKDLTLNRTLRFDIWCREPAERSTSFPELFGGFSYGSLLAEKDIPARIETQRETVDLSTPLFQKLISLMTLMPMGIGDFLAHPNGQGFDTTEILGAIQILIACGIAQPMRGLYRAENVSNIAQPRFAGDFNRILGHTQLASQELLLASPAMGAAVSISAREVLVMQALDRAGLANSVSALLPELERMAQDPALARLVGDGATPTAKTAQTMIEDTLSRSIVQWYAYGLLEAA